jgi:hypothetical protein
MTVLAVAAPTRDEWHITDNDPEPFCNDPQSPDFTSTWITIWGEPEEEPTAEIIFEIWDPDALVVLYRLDLGEKPPGSYVFIW